MTAGLSSLPIIRGGRACTILRVGSAAGGCGSFSTCVQAESRHGSSAGARRVLILQTEADAVGFELLGERRERLASGRVGTADYSAASIDQLLRSHGLARKDVVIGIRLPAALYFDRKLVLPAATSHMLADVARQDLVAKTPFRLDDIYHGHATSDAGERDKILLWQWVIRREFVGNAVASLGIDLESVSFIDAAPGNDRSAPPPIIHLRRDDGGRSLVRKIALAMGIGTLLLAAIVVGLKYWQQQATIDELGTQVAAAKTKAQQVRLAIDKLDQGQLAILQLRLRKTQTPGLLDVWNELTRVLPAHSWLTELRLTEMPDKTQQVAMNGLSAAASSLVGLIDQSPLFGETSLTAPIATDPIEGRERFGLQAKVRQPIQAKNAP